MVRNSVSVGNLFEMGMGTGSKNEVSKSVPRIKIGSQRKNDFQRYQSMRSGTIKGCIDYTANNTQEKKTDDYYLNLL